MFKRRSLRGGGENDNSEAKQSGFSQATGGLPSSLAPASTPSPSGNPQSEGARRPQQNAPRAEGARNDGPRRRNRRRGKGRGTSPGQSQNQVSGQPPVQGAGTASGTSRNQGRNQNQSRAQQPQQQRSGPPNNQQRNQGPRANQNQQRTQQPQGQQRPGQRGPQQGPNRGRVAAPALRRPPPPPPAYFQRGLILVAQTEHAKAIDEVRTKFDPLVKKVPAHITLLLPEPKGRINDKFLRSLNYEGLPSLLNLTFTQVIVHNDKYLFLLPDEESRQRIQQWRDLVLGPLPEDHTQGVEFIPHLTLGYIPRSMTAEDAVAFARNLISLPLTVTFEKLLLEEFEENQLSKEIDALKMDEPFPVMDSAPLDNRSASTGGNSSDQNQTALTKANDEKSDESESDSSDGSNPSGDSAPPQS